MWGPMLKLITTAASATFILALTLAPQANAEGRPPSCPTDTKGILARCTWAKPFGGTYVGGWKDGQQNGQGTETWLDGREYVGAYRDGQRNGQGIETWPDGHKYVGEFRDDKENGQATVTFPNGETKVGEWKDGVPNGQATYTWQNGETGEITTKGPVSPRMAALTTPPAAPAPPMAGPAIPAAPMAGPAAVNVIRGGIPSAQGDGGINLLQLQAIMPLLVAKYRAEHDPATMARQALNNATQQQYDTYLAVSRARTMPEGPKNKQNGHGTIYSSNGSVKQSGVWKDDTRVEPFAENHSIKTIASALGLQEKMNQYFYLIGLFIVIVSGVVIAAKLLMKYRIARSITASSPTAVAMAPATPKDSSRHPK